jgi:predicted RNA-binding protein YlxR (DUF448 family)
LKRGHVALRTCLGCGGKFPKSRLFRFTMGPGGVAGGNGPGRGHYLCFNAGCLDKALERRGLSRLLGRMPDGEEVKRLRRDLLESGSSFI